MKKKIVIIGAGIAGISAAKELLETGRFEITVLERNNYIGGRCCSFTDKEKNEFDNGQHIMAGAYLSAISQLTDLFINISVPSLTIDMLGAIMSVPAIEFAQVGDKVLLINESFIIDNKHIKSNMILIPEVSSLDILLKKLGVN